MSTNFPKRWIFVGATDKQDLLLYVASVLAAAGQRVLLIDATSSRRYRYVVDGVCSGIKVTEFCGFDVISIDNYEGNMEGELYHYKLVDCDDFQLMKQIGWMMKDMMIWVTTYNRADILKSVEFFDQLFDTEEIHQEIEILPIFLNTVECAIYEDYVLHYMEHFPIHWLSDGVSIRWDDWNEIVRIESGHEQTLGLHRISRDFKRAVKSLIVQLSGWEEREVNRAFRIAERRK